MELRITWIELKFMTITESEVQVMHETTFATELKNIGKRANERLDLTVVRY